MRVAIVGGGYAGMAAAVTLADAGVTVTVYEAARELGGRARRVVLNGIALDNGLHILIGAYSETLRLIRAVHPRPDSALSRFRLDWRIQNRFHLRTAALPAPFNVAWGLLTARGAPLIERLRAARFMGAMRARRFRLDNDTTVSELLRAHGQGPAITRYLWDPLCLAALNTPPAVASARVFLNVLRDGLDADASAADMLLARDDLTSLFPAPAADYVKARGGEVIVGQTIDALDVQREGVGVRSRAGTRKFDHAIVAVSPHRAGALLGTAPGLEGAAAMVERFTYQPIYSVYLQFEAPVRAPAPMTGLQGPAQWLFDRDAICGQRGLLAVVMSGEGAHENVTQDELAVQVRAQLTRELGALPPLAWHRVIAEKRATFACTPDLERPSTRTALANVHLAGDYTASDYPATIEAAVRSGIAAAKQVLARL